MSDLMTAYLDQLTRELSFDPSLARRMRAEAEDHLQEAVASDPMGVTTEAERRAIARFGAARDIAPQCAVPHPRETGEKCRRGGDPEPCWRIDRHEDPRCNLCCDFAGCQRRSGSRPSAHRHFNDRPVCVLVRTADRDLRLGLYQHRLRIGRSPVGLAEAPTAIAADVCSGSGCRRHHGRVGHDTDRAQVVAGRTGRDPVSVPDHWA